jgi:hypothetical protein
MEKIRIRDPSRIRNTRFFFLLVGVKLVVLQVSELLGLEGLTTLHLDMEEYLHGLCHLRSANSKGR